MVPLSISRAEIDVESRFEPRLWTLHHNVPALYEALLRNLTPVGLSTLDLRPDAGDGSVGGSGLGFWLFAFRANVRVKLEAFTFQCRSLGGVTRPQIVQAIGGVMAAIGQASDQQATFTGHTISYSCHGQLQGLPVTEFIRRFVPVGPAVERFGNHLGSGTAFYFGEAQPVLSSILTIDPSRELQDGLFVRVVLMIDGTPKSAEDLAQVSVERVRGAFSALDLDVGEPWS